MAKANEPKSQMETTAEWNETAFRRKPEGTRWEARAKSAKSTELKPDPELLPSGAPHAPLALRVPHTRELSHRKSEGTIRSVGAVTSSMP